eukprot:s4425_g4.t1
MILEATATVTASEPKPTYLLAHVTRKPRTRPVVSRKLPKWWVLLCTEVFGVAPTSCRITACTTWAASRSMSRKGLPDAHLSQLTRGLELQSLRAGLGFN